MVALEWVAPEGCPSLAQMRVDIARLMGTAGAAAPVRSVAVATRASSGGWSVRAETTSDGGRDVRTVEGESCQAVAEATALFIALAADSGGPASSPEEARTVPAASEPSPPPPLAPPTRAPATPDREPAPAADPATSPTASRPLRFLVGASSRLDVGVLPRPVPGAEIRVGLQTSRVLLELAGTRWLTESASLSTAPPIGGTFAMTSASLRGCYRLTPRTWSVEIGPCGEGEVDVVAASGYGSLVPSSGTTWWTALAAGGTVAWQLATLVSVRGLAEAQAPLARPRFLVDNTPTAHRPASVSLRAGIGVELSFP